MKRKGTRSAAAVLGMAFAALFAHAASAATPQLAAVPLKVELNRPYADIKVTGPQGHARTGRFWLDTGGGAILLSHEFAARLGLKPSGKAFRNEGMLLAPIAVPALSLGGMKLDLSEGRAYIVMDSPKALNHTAAVGAFPVHMLRSYNVVFDYPGRQLTVAQPDALVPHGQAVKTYIGKSGMPVVTLEVDGAAHDFLLDTGGSYCMISAALLQNWGKAHIDWPRVRGAFGPANMLMGSIEPKLEMTRVGTMQWGPFKLHGIGAVSRPVGVYEKWMSRIAGRPVVGSVAGNLLQAFRVDIDYPKGQVYLKRAPSIDDQPIDMVGITLEPQAGGYVIAAKVPELTQLRVGDRLLGVDGLKVTHASVAQTMAALQGKPGSSHELRIERGGKVLTVTANVRRIL